MGLSLVEEVGAGRQGIRLTPRAYRRALKPTRHLQRRGGVPVVPRQSWRCQAHARHGPAERRDRQLHDLDSRKGAEEAGARCRSAEVPKCGSGDRRKTFSPTRELRLLQIFFATERLAVKGYKCGQSWISRLPGYLGQWLLRGAHLGAHLHCRTS